MWPACPSCGSSAWWLEGPEAGLCSVCKSQRIDGTEPGMSEQEIALAREGRLMTDEATVPVILTYFTYEHLPERLARISRPFRELALGIVDTLPDCAERSVALRKLLEAKDAAVRAAL